MDVFCTSWYTQFMRQFHSCKIPNNGFCFHNVNLGSVWCEFYVTLLRIFVHCKLTTFMMLRISLAVFFLLVICHTIDRPTDQMTYCFIGQRDKWQLLSMLIILLLFHFCHSFWPCRIRHYCYLSSFRIDLFCSAMMSHSVYLTFVHF